MPAATYSQDVADTGCVFLPLALDTPAPNPGIKLQQLSSGQGMPNLGQEEETLCDSPKEPPWKKQKPLARALRELWIEAFSKDSEVVKQQGRPTTRPTEPCFSRKGLMTSPQFLGYGLGNKPFECWDIQGAGDLDQPAETEGHQSHHKSIPKGHTVFLHSNANQITQHHGAKGDPLPWSPLLARWPLLLLLMQKERTKWGHHCKPPKDHSLSSGPGMHLVHGIFHYQHGHNEVACVCL